MRLSILAQNIERRKSELGFSTSIELAKKSAVSRAVLTNIKLNPSKSIMLDSAVRLAKALNCRLEWLATGEGSPTLDDFTRLSQIEAGAPIIKLNQLLDTDVGELLDTLMTADVPRIPCPSGNAKSQIAIRLDKQLGKYYAGGTLFFNTDKKPISGQLIIVLSSDNVEIMEYQSAHSRQFLRCLSEDIPDELKFVEMTENHQLIATYEAFAMF